MAIEELEEIPVQFPVSDAVFAPGTFSIHQDGNSFRLQGLETVEIRNDRAGPGDIIAKVIGKGRCSQNGLHDLTVTVVEGQKILFGPLDTHQFHENGLCEIQYTEDDGTPLPDDDDSGHPASLAITILRLYRNL